MNTPTLGILMILGTLGLLVLGAVVLVHARLRSRPLPVRALVAVGGGWAALYLVALGVSSLTSRERLLGLNEDKQFCGFYLDCHLQVAVSGVDTARALGPANAPLRARGVFYVVTLRVSSTAVAARMHLLDPQLVIRDAAGREYTPAPDVPMEPLTKNLGPREAFQTTVVFDLPADVVAPRLSVTEGIWADKLIELFLIGDEDSLLHKRTAFELTT